jgi:hypothetical protein
MKKCGACKKWLRDDEFGFRAASKDGLAAKCRGCQSTYDKARANDPHRVKARAEYQNTDRGRQAGSRAKKAWADRNTVKRAAHILIGNAIRDGRIVSAGMCETCESTDNLHAHHHDYAHPLGVTWLCASCHSQWHKRNGEGENAN